VTGVVILDACRNNPLPAREGTRNSARGLSDMDAPPGVSAFILYSAAKGQVASDGEGRNSPFTSALLSALETPAREIDDIIYDVSYSMRLQSEGRQVPWAEFAFAGRTVPSFVDMPAGEPVALDEEGTSADEVPVAQDISEVVWSGISALEDPAARYGAAVGFVAQFPDSPRLPEAESLIAEYEANATRVVVSQHSLEDEEGADAAPVLDEEGKEVDVSTAATDVQDGESIDAEVSSNATEQLTNTTAYQTDEVTQVVPVARGPIEEEGIPTNETIHLVSGFEPDPVARTFYAGGFEDASYFGTQCVGFVSSQADFVIDYEAGQYKFFISAASEADTVLVVRDPAGTYHCSDDFIGPHPAVTFNDPQAGAYRVWVGTYERSGLFQRAKLILSERQPLY